MHLAPDCYLPIVLGDLATVTAQKQAWRVVAEYVEEYVPYKHGSDLYEAARALDPEEAKS